VQKIATKHPDVWELVPDFHPDERGFFMETYHQQKLADLDIRDVFVQDNHSQSQRNTLRGLHYQLEHPQAKICRVIAGSVLDVAVDLRLGSDYFGRYVSLRLSAEERNQIYIPAGFAHGFIALTDVTQFVYKCSAFYDKDDEYGIIWDDPDIGIEWGLDFPVISDKDNGFPSLRSRREAGELPEYRGT
jgi:dTDP-4-dehydrorhamnose 3,5-epimerase